MKLCSFEGCGQTARCKRLCPAHYEQARRGTPLKPVRSWSVEHEFCPNGHPWVTENILVTKAGHKNCRICARKRTAAWKAKKKCSAELTK